MQLNWCSAKLRQEEQLAVLENILSWHGALDALWECATFSPRAAPNLMQLMPSRRMAHDLFLVLLSALARMHAPIQAWCHDGHRSAEPTHQYTQKQTCASHCTSKLPPAK